MNDVDCISRADALDCVNIGITFCDVYKKINDLPSVRPQPRKGRWIFDGDCLICSKCKKAYSFTGSNFCPNCGAKMVEPQESED